VISLRHDSYSESNSISPGHEDNQDSFLVDTANHIFAVADGVGGYRGGKEASQLAMDTLRASASKISDESSTIQVLKEIHDKVRNRARSLHYLNMGTTIAVVKVLSDLAENAKLITGNVGDSPILLFPANSDDFRYIFTDDSHRDSDPGSMWGITQYLGLDEIEIDFHVRILDCKKQDIVLVCSDGVTDNLLNSGLQKGMRLPDIVRKFKSAKKIVKEALDVGIKADDMTAILITV
jgi:serine/threonine protein phosphatase PrpC